MRLSRFNRPLTRMEMSDSVCLYALDGVVYIYTQGQTIALNCNCLPHPLNQFGTVLNLGVIDGVTHCRITTASNEEKIPLPAGTFTWWLRTCGAIKTCADSPFADAKPLSKADITESIAA